MPAHHFFVEPGDVSEGMVSLSGTEAHHAARVLRLRRGEEISVADGSGRVMHAVVVAVGDTVDAEISETHTAEPPRPELTLYQAVAKGDRMDIVVQKAVEIGVRRIVPLFTERTVVRWDERRRSRARVRWTEIARAAAKQCRSPWPSDVDAVRDGLGVVPAGGPAVVLEASAERRLRDVLPNRPPETLALVVGPEGGLSDDELGGLRSTGASVASLGDRVLRTETAGPVAAALVLYAYGSLG